MLGGGMEKDLKKPEVKKSDYLGGDYVVVENHHRKWEKYHEQEIEKLKEESYKWRDLSFANGNKVLSLEHKLRGLPTEEEIEGMLKENWNHLFSPEENYLGRLKLAKLIHKRITQ